MKLKLLIVDLELSSRQKRLVAVAVGAIGFTVAAFASAGVPHHWNDGETLRAADLNDDFAALDGRISALEGKEPLVTAWTPYSPQVTAGATTLTVTPEAPTASTGYWRRVGDTIEVSLSTTIANCSAAPSGTIQWTLPPGVTADVTKTAHLTGHALVYDMISSFFDADVEIGDTVVALDKPPAGGGLHCSQVADNSTVRIRFAAPVVGWTVTN